MPKKKKRDRDSLLKTRAKESFGGPISGKNWSGKGDRQHRSETPIWKDYWSKPFVPDPFIGRPPDKEARPTQPSSPPSSKKIRALQRPIIAQSHRSETVADRKKRITTPPRERLPIPPKKPKKRR